MNAYNHYDDTQTKYRQIIYLSKKRGEPVDFIANLTHYAVSTVRNYIKKFAHLLEEACELFKHSRKKKERLLHPEVPGIKFTCPDDLADGEKFYLIRAFDKCGKRIFSKVGTTARTVIQRMKEHLKYYEKLGVVEIIVDQIWNCGNIPAEGLESWFRAIYIRKWPDKFNKNDRFFDVDFDLDEAQMWYEKYLALEI